jgi:hypothetical protein
MQFLNVESAYSSLADYLLAFIGDRAWQKACGKFKIFKKMAQGEQYFENDGKTHDQGGFEDSSNAMWDGLDAALYLRDDLLKTTGKRIWGLTFTLYPTGKFNIEYDYNKPEDYEETDEVITGEEINASLSNLTAPLKP